MLQNKNMRSDPRNSFRSWIAWSAWSTWSNRRISIKGLRSIFIIIIRTEIRISKLVNQRGRSIKWCDIKFSKINRSKFLPWINFMYLCLVISAIFNDLRYYSIHLLINYGLHLYRIQLALFEKIEKFEIQKIVKLNIYLFELTLWLSINFKWNYSTPTRECIFSFIGWHCWNKI